MADEFILGQHEATLRDVVERLDAVNARLNRIEIALAEKRGERRVAIWLAGVAGAFVSLFAKTLLGKFGISI